MKKEELRNLFATNMALWGFVMIIAKVIYPQFIYLEGVTSALGNGNAIVLFYLCGIIFFVLLSYISFLCGLITVYDGTIGKIIRIIKKLFNEFESYEDYYYESECYTSTDILLTGAYTFAALPIMMYLIFPALATVLPLIFILYCFLHN